MKTITTEALDKILEWLDGREPGHETTLPLAKRYLDAIATYTLTGYPPDEAPVNAFDALYPPGSRNREFILIDAHIELMVDEMMKHEQG